MLLKRNFVPRLSSIIQDTIFFIIDAIIATSDIIVFIDMS